MKKKLMSSEEILSSETTTVISIFKSRKPFILSLFVLMGTLLFSSCSNDSSVTDIESDAVLAANQKLIIVSPGDIPSDIKGQLTASDETFKTTEAPGEDRGRFNITLKYVVEVSDRQKEVFEAAAARWERIIIKDVPSITATIPSSFQGFPPVLNGTVDDIIIEVAIAPIDGPGAILGQAGPRYLRTADRLPITGIMFFDIDDLDFLDEIDLFEEVIVHEMGHVLGVGTLWNYFRTLRQGPTTNPYFTGKMANVFWKAEGGLDFLPVENQGGPGTAGGHWRESLLRNELMTGFLNLGENPLSRITAGSLKDMGYGTAIVAEQYELLKGTPGVDINELAKSGLGNGLNIAEMEILLEPLGFVTTD